MVDEQDLRKAQQRYERAAARFDEARRGRNRLVREAIAEGIIRKAQIGRVTGLTRARIGQIAETQDD